MSNTRRTLTVLAVAVVLAAALPSQAAEPVRLLAPTSSDVAARALVIPVETKALPPVSRETVTFSWALKPDETINLQPSPHVTTSREYWQRVTADQLRSGVAVETTAPGALIRVNPIRQAASDELVAIDPHSLSLRTADGRVLRDAEGMSQLATAEELSQAGAPFPEGTSAFRLSPRAGAGKFILRAPELPADSKAVYVINVFDKDSPAALKLQAARDVFFTGDTLEATAVLDADGRKLPVQAVTAELVSPDGAVTPLKAATGPDGTVRITGTLSSRTLAGPGLWEIHTSATGRMDQLTVRRDARTAFSYTIPTARLTGDADLSVSENGFNLSVGVEAAVSGRYEVRGILFGTGDDGKLHPAVRADAAAWLEPGTGIVTLVIDGAQLARTGLKAPFELRDLRLMDQGRMQVLHRQARAAVLTPTELGRPRGEEGRLN